MSEPHQIVSEGKETYAPVVHSTLRCPACLSSWDGGEIPENIRQHYSPPYRWKKVIGVEIPGVYDGVHHWACPNCLSTFPRWRESADGVAVSRMFNDDLHVTLTPKDDGREQRHSGR